MIEVQAQATPRENVRFVRLSKALSALAGSAVGVGAQMMLDRGGDLTAGLFAFALAAGLFVYGTWSLSVENTPHAQEAAAANTRFKPILFAISFAMAAVAFLDAGDNQFRIPGVLAWGGSIVLYLKALPHAWTLEAAWQSVRSRVLAEGISVSWEWVLVGVITLVGTFFRFYRLDGLPAEMGTDLPLNYGNVQEILRGNFLVFFPSFPGRESLFFYFAAVLARLFGNSHLTLKAAAALVGTSTIPLAYFVGRRLFNRNVGIFAAALLALSYWHIILSRIGYRAILMPLFVLVLAYLMANSMDRPSDWRVTLAGLWLGLGLYTYNSFFLAPPAFVAVVVLQWIARRELSLASLLRFIAVAAGGALLAWVPLARYGFDHPDSYLFRAATRISGAEQPLPRDLMGTLGSNIARTFGMFNVSGDAVQLVNVPYLREMGMVTPVLFVLGVAYGVARWRRGYNAIVLGLFVILLMPSALALAFPNEVASSDRASGGVTMAFLLAALTLPLLGQRLCSVLPFVRGGPWSARLSLHGYRTRVRVWLDLRSTWLLIPAAVALLLITALEAYNVVFVIYPARQTAANYAISRELARVLDDYAGNGPEYIEYWPHWFDGNALSVQLTRTTYDRIRFVENLAATVPPIEGSSRALYLLYPGDTPALDHLHATYQRGTTVRFFDDLGNVQFIAFYAEVP